MTSGIYKFTNLLTNRVYIGSSSKIEERYLYHISGRGSKPLGCAISKYGISNFKFEILEVVDQKNMLYTREQFYLDMYFAQEYVNSGGVDKRFRKFTYNLQPLASKATGIKWSNKSKEKLKKKFRERGHTCAGRKFSEESILKIRNTHKERKVSVGERNPNYGKKTSLSKINKFRDTYVQKGVCKPFIAISKDGVVYGPYRSSGECSDAIGVYKCQIKRCLKGTPKYKSAKGYIFKYVES